MTLFRKLRELEKKATPGPWVWASTKYDFQSKVDTLVEGPGDVTLFRGAMGATVYDNDKVLWSNERGSDDLEGSPEDMRLIAEMRNALPKIFEVLDLYEEALEAVTACNSVSDKAFHVVHDALRRAKEIGR